MCKFILKQQKVYIYIVYIQYFFPKCFLYENLCIWIFFYNFASKIEGVHK